MANIEAKIARVVAPGGRGGNNGGRRLGDL